MSKKNLLIGLIFIATISVALLFKNKIEWSLNKNTILSQREDEEKKDQKTLEHADTADPSALYMAVIHLSLHPTPDVIEKVIALSQSKDSKTRAAAAFFLVNQTDAPSMNAVKPLLRDSDPEVKSSIAKGLNYHPLPERVPIIRDYLASGNLSDTERTTAFSALYRSVPTQNEKETVLKTLIDFTNQSKNADLSQTVLLELCNLAPENEKVLALLRNAIQKNQKLVAPVAIRTLAVRRDPWLKENISHLVFSPEAELKRAAIESLHYVCPISRWDLIEKGLIEEKTEPMIRVWIQEVEQMPGAQAEELLNRLAKSERVKGTNIQSIVAEALMKVKASKTPDFCHN